MPRKLSDPLTKEDKEWLASWNRDNGDGEQQAEETTDEGEGGEEAEGYQAFSNEDLRDELRSRDLPTGGNKAELIARLEADDEG